MYFSMSFVGNYGINPIYLHNNPNVLLSFTDTLSTRNLNLKFLSKPLKVTEPITDET